MGIFGDIGGSLGDIAGALSGGGADDAQQQFYRELIQKYGKLDPRIAAQQSDNSGLLTSGADSRAAQMDALREFQNTYRSGGLDANARAGIAEANDAANRNAMANRNAVAESARAHGAGRSGVAMALEQGAGQSAMGDANLAASRAAATAEGTRLGAMGAAGTLGGQVRGQDYQAAAAQDAINRFNAQMRQGAAQSTFENQMGQLGGEGNAYAPVYTSGKANEARIARLYGSIGRMGGNAADAAMGMPGGGGGFGGYSGMAETDMPSWLKQQQGSDIPGGT